MKLLTLPILLFLLPIITYGQNLRHTGFYNELNLVTSDTEFEPINVLTGGAGFFKHIPVGEKFAISLNSGYQRKGFNVRSVGYDFTSNPIGIITVEHRLDMFHLSMGAKLYLNSIISLEVAPVFNLVLVGTADKSPASQSFYSNYEGGYETILPFDNYEDFELGMVFRLSIQPISRWYIGLAYDRSITDIAEGVYYLSGQGDNLRFSTIQFRVAWAFWEKNKKFSDRDL